MEPLCAAVGPLTPESSCCRDLNWRCDLQAEADPGLVEEFLTGQGYLVRCRHPALRVFRHPRGLEIAWVLTTNRVQIRVPVHVAREERPAVAQDVYSEFCKLFAPGDFTSHPPSNSASGVKRTHE